MLNRQKICKRGKQIIALSLNSSTLKVDGPFLFFKILENELSSQQFKQFKMHLLDFFELISFKSRVSSIRILVLILFLFSSFKLESAEKSLNEIQISNSQGESMVRVALSENVEPIIRFVPRESYWVADFPDVIPEVPLTPSASKGCPLKLIRFSEIREPFSHLRIFFHVKPETNLKLIHEKDGYTFSFKPGEIKLNAIQNPISPESYAGRLPNSLLAPCSVGNFKEIVLDVKNASTKDLFQELSNQAQIKIRFRTPPPKKVTYKGHETSALKAMARLAENIGMVLSREGDLWCLTDVKHPILLIPVDEMICGDIIEGLTFREAVFRLAGEDLAKKFLTSCSFDEQEKKIRGVAKLSAPPRILIEYLLNSQFVSIDSSENTGKL
ncbi:MAG: hypothetical protein HQM08_21295 [Candidatus Riflebacteria bacterium]|nr:hypothetical protein [Candidatus Riflebacteria bacterium]